MEGICNQAIVATVTNPLKWAVIMARLHEDGLTRHHSNMEWKYGCVEVTDQHWWVK